MNRKRLFLLLTSAIIIIIFIVFISININNKHTTNNPKSNTTQDNIGSNTPPAEALSVVKRYITAQVNSVGADQPTPTSWISNVQSITTISWFTELQPVQSTTSSTPREFYIAHSNGYIITPTITNCYWNTTFSKNTSNSGFIACFVYDTTRDVKTNSAINESNLPFGWSRSGLQPNEVFKVVKQGSSWLVAGVTYGE
jgi:hypothetical protein